jgi:hypothetical protein
MGDAEFKGKDPDDPGGGIEMDMAEADPGSRRADRKD